ncbi:transporter [Bacillus sp. 3103sda1]|uniref:transporter n=1 Tax=Bacillus sp. 3103sda1 TaxID=2953808 RepID=UPI0020A0EBA6|nr:transporter [Bacillus sp. 3103sda1]MCP1125520.1 transporter [Bacillus sp. 3103sda1]
MSLEALIIFSLLNAGQLAENEKTHLQKNQSEQHVYVEKQERNETMNIKLK